MLSESEENKDAQKSLKDQREQIFKNLDNLSSIWNKFREKLKKIAVETEETRPDQWYYLEIQVENSPFGTGKSELAARGGLQKLGKDGWELAAIETISIFGTSTHKYIFKRKYIASTEDAKHNIQIEDEIHRIDAEIQSLSKRLETLIPDQR